MARPNMLDVRLGTHPGRNTDDIARFYARHLRCDELHAGPEIMFFGFVATSEQKLYLATYFEGDSAWMAPVTSMSARAHSNLEAYNVILHPWSREFAYPYSICALHGQQGLALATRTCWSRISAFVDGPAWPSDIDLVSQGSLNLLNGDRHVSRMTEIHRLSDANQIWDIASAPSQHHSSSTSRFALASTHGLHVKECCDGLVRDLVSLQMNSPSGQKVVTFKDHNVIMTGQYDGILNFTDCRGPEQTSSAPRLKHSGGAVTGVVSTRNEAVIIVSGFDGIATYDLRYVQAPPHQQSDHAVPLLRFQTSPELTSDHYMSGKRVAYSAALDICVVASCGQNVTPRDRVTLYQASTGRKLDANINSHNHTRNGRVQGVGVAQVRDGPESIIVLQESAVQEWNVMNDDHSDGDAET